MRIVSLLPSATEIACALGLEDDLVGVTHECDWPPSVRSRPSVTRSLLDAASEPAEVDRLVSGSVTTGAPIYGLELDVVRRLRPDIVLTQDLCAVCAVPSGHVHQALDVLGCSAEVVSMDPGTVDGVLSCILDVGRVTGTEGRAAALVQRLRARLAHVAGAVAGRERPRTFALEWSDPPFTGGHWVPEMIATAGGDPVLGRPGTPSVRVRWEEVGAAAPDTVVFMPCGYALPQSVTEGRRLLARPELDSARAVFAVDASAYFSRPGPRLVDGVEILARALHPDVAALVPAPDGAISRLR